MQAGGRRFDPGWLHYFKLLVPNNLKAVLFTRNFAVFDAFFVPGRKMKNRLPKICRRADRNLAYVTLRGRKVYFGKYGSPESYAEYERVIAECLTGPIVETGPDCLLCAFASAFLARARDYYVKNGKQTGQLDLFRAALEFPLRRFPATPPRKRVVTPNRIRRSFTAQSSIAEFLARYAVNRSRRSTLATLRRRGRDGASARSPTLREQANEPIPSARLRFAKRRVRIAFDERDAADTQVVQFLKVSAFFLSDFVGFGAHEVGDRVEIPRVVPGKFSDSALPSSQGCARRTRHATSPPRFRSPRRRDTSTFLLARLRRSRSPRRTSKPRARTRRAFQSKSRSEAPSY